jgi:hypothetical protein
MTIFKFIDFTPTHQQQHQHQHSHSQQQPHFIHQINNNFVLHIEGITQSIACLYITNELNERIQIPKDFKVFTYNHNGKIQQPQADPSCHILSWSDDYIIELQNTQIISLVSQRSWNISI